MVARATDDMEDVEHHRPFNVSRDCPCHALIDPLNRYDFTWRLSVRTPDLNRANHMSAYALVGLLDEAYTHSSII